MKNYSEFNVACCNYPTTDHTGPKQTKMVK